MPTSRTIPKSEWRSFFDGLSQSLTGKRVEVEVASLELGDQIVAEWVPLLGVSYDSHDDLLDVSLAGLDHLIRNPRDIYVQEGPGGVTSIAVQAADGTKQILTMKDPIMLPATAGRAGRA